jgi:hypothetical protein
MFRGTCHLHLQGLEVSQARNQHEVGGKQSLLLPTSSLFLGLFFDPEDGTDTFLQNSVGFQQTTEHLVTIEIIILRHNTLYSGRQMQLNTDLRFRDLKDSPI